MCELNYTYVNERRVITAFYVAKISVSFILRCSFSLCIWNYEKNDSEVAHNVIFPKQHRLHLSRVDDVILNFLFEVSIKGNFNQMNAVGRIIFFCSEHICTKLQCTFDYFR